MIKNLIWLIPLGLILLATPSAQAQNIHRSTLGSNGTSTEVILKGKTYHVSQSIGQASVIGTVSSSGYVVGQGFQQSSLHVAKINESINDLDVAIYPNPVITTLNIRINEEVLSRVDVFLYDMAGVTKHNDSYESSQTYQVDMTVLKTGIYILRLRMGEKNFTTQLIKK